ncbi:MAG: hypothetical protein IPL56_00790 [Saprospiraceae bacterium]|nr:hypothetical protein [Saprospiraceae bacterium]
MDATVDLDYNQLLYYPQLSLWDQSGGEQNTGRYWMVFNSKNHNSNLFGFFQGKPSLLIGARLSGPQLVLSPKDEESNEEDCAEIYVFINRRTGDNLWFPRKRYQWGVYISNTNEIVAPEKDQAIVKEMNLRSGLAGTIRVKASKPVKLNPSFYQGAIYLPASEIRKMIKRVKLEDDYYYHLIRLDGVYRSMWDAWKFKDSATAILGRMLTLRSALIENYLNSDGTFRKDTRYWIGVRNFKITAFTISGLFADSSIPITKNERKELELLMGLMARIVWDDDNVPLADEAGVNRGPANMVHQYINNGRNFFALLLSHDAEFKSRADRISADIKRELGQVIFKNGSSFGSPHYTQAALDPIFFSCLQIRQAGLGDLFKDPRITQYSKFLISLVTPPSCRFNGYRKLISFGDGSEESGGSFGLLATGLRTSDSVLSKKLMSLYFNGPPNYIFAGPAPLAISSEYVGKNSNLELTDCSYDGFVTHFRTAANRPLESAVWILNGETFYDHRNDDRGEVAIYALGAPLSLSRSSFYMPRADGSKIRSMVVPYNMFPEWSAAEQEISSPTVWSHSQQLEFADMQNSSYTRIKMTNSNRQEWYRSCMKIEVNDSFPIYVLHDSVSVESVWSMMMMSEGPIITPSGPMTTIRKMHNNVDLKQLPEGTPARTMHAGWNKFGFTGQNWIKHPTNGINWNIYSFSSSETQFSLAQWGTTWQTTNESNDYKLTNSSEYKEEQQILRIKSKSPFLNVMIPYVKGDDALYQVNSQTPNCLKYKTQDMELEIYANAYKRTSKSNQLLAWFGNKAHMVLNGIEAKGGSIEVEIKKQPLLVMCMV